VSMAALEARAGPCIRSPSGAEDAVGVPVTSGAMPWWSDRPVAFRRRL